MTAKSGLSRALLFAVLASLSATAFADVQCGTSATRHGCSSVQTFPCRWLEHRCEYQYDYISLDCLQVPSGSSVSISCTAHNDVEYEVNVLDGPNYENYYGEMNDGRTCLNGLCDTLTIGTYEWSGETPNTEDEPYWIVIDKEDANVCLDITCTVEIV